MPKEVVPAWTKERKSSKKQYWLHQSLLSQDRSVQKVKSIFSEKTLDETPR